MLSNWFFSGPNALDPAAPNANANPPFPIGTYSFNSQPNTFTCSTTILYLHPLWPMQVRTACSAEQSPVLMNATGQGGTWSGGAGAFSNANLPNATYTPAPSEIGTTVILTWTTTGTFPCVTASDAVSLTSLQEPDAEFSYENSVCPFRHDRRAPHHRHRRALHLFYDQRRPQPGAQPHTGQINTNASNLGPTR